MHTLSKNRLVAIQFLIYVNLYRCHGIKILVVYCNRHFLDHPLM